MPQERPNHYGHLVPGAPEYPVKTVHFPNVAEAAERRRARWMIGITIAYIAGLLIAGLIGGLLLWPSR